MSSTTAPAPLAAVQAPPPGGPAQQPLSAPRMVKQRRRRPGLIALSVALIAVGGLSGAALYESSGQRTSVVVMAHDVPVGSQITRRDLGEASVALDPAVKSVEAGSSNKLVGQRATVDLKVGSLLTVAQVTKESLVGPNEQLVGVSVKPSQLPATSLRPGQSVLVVSTPDPNAAAGSLTTATDESAPETLKVTVVAVGQPATATGVVVVDVAVSSGDGPALAARVATGNIALILASRDGN